jgi:hypothetical protein
MFSVTAAVRAALLGGHVPCARLVSLDAQGDVVATWEASTGVLTEGSVVFDRTSLVRRSGSMTLANPRGDLSPRIVGDTFYTGARFRAERGVVITGVATWIPLATLVVTGFAAAKGGALLVTGEDPLSLLAQPFGEVATVKAGTPAADALRQLWAPVLDAVGMGASWVLDDGGRRTALRVFLEDEDRLAAGLALMADLGLIAHADRLGQPVLLPAPDPMAAGVATVRELRPGATSLLLDLERRGSSRPYNRVIVDVVATDRPAIRAIVEITDPGSPIHKDRIGVQTAPVYRTTQTPSQAAANAVARALLTEYALANDQVTSSLVPDPTLEEDDVVMFEEAVSGTADRYRLDRLTHPLLTGPLQVEASKVMPVLEAAE